MGFQGTLFWNKSIWQLQVVKYHNCGENYASIEWACSNLFNQPRDVPSKPADPLIVALSFQLVKSIQVIAGIRLKRNSFFQDAIYAVSMLISRFPFFFLSIFEGCYTEKWPEKSQPPVRNLPGSTWPAAQLARSHSSQWPKISAEGCFANQLPPLDYVGLYWIILYTTKI